MQLGMQEFNREDSCEKCDLDGPPIIAPNRGYLALLGAMGNSEYALLLAGAPTAFEGLFAGIQSVFTAVGFPPEAVPAAALAQFGQVMMSAPFVCPTCRSCGRHALLTVFSARNAAKKELFSTMNGWRPHAAH